MAVNSAVQTFDAAYQGAPGAYSEQAAEAFLGTSARLLPLSTLDEVVSAVVAGRARAAVMPVENSLAGTVPNAYELLVDHALVVCGEATVAIDHVLVARGSTRRSDVRRVLSHPVALAQCRAFFRRHPELEPVPAFDTAGAVLQVVREADGISAAIASRRAAKLHDAVVLEEGVQDHRENWTRFLLARSATVGCPTAAGDRKALIVFELPHAPGALSSVLNVLGRRGLNLTHIESRPIHGRPFEYRFIVELAIPAGDSTLDAALGEMSAVTSWQRLAGLYAVT